MHKVAPAALAFSCDNHIHHAFTCGRSGELANFTGIDQPYETPEAPEMSIDTTTLSAEAACERIVSYLQERHYL